MPDDPTPPRKRAADSDRRRWNDRALDMLGQRVGSHAEDIEELRMELRAVSRLPEAVASLRREFERESEERRDDHIETRKDIRELRAENRTHHTRVAYGKDPENGVTPLPPHAATLTWGAVARIAAVVAAFFVPAATIVAALVGGS